MRISPSIQNDSGILTDGFLNPSDQLTFMVALAAGDVKAEFTSRTRAQSLNVAERCGTVYFRLPHAQHVEVRSVENQEALLLRHVWCSLFLGFAGFINGDFELLIGQCAGIKFATNDKGGRAMDAQRIGKVMRVFHLFGNLVILHVFLELIDI